jgi:hypothetical protein
MRADSLGLELSEEFSCTQLLCLEKANLVHYCIERYLALALIYSGIVAVVLPWYCLPQHPSFAEQAFAGWLVCSMGWRFRLCLRPPPEGRTYVHTYYRRAIRRVYEGFLVLTPWFIKEVWEVSRTHPLGQRIRPWQPSACGRGHPGLLL